MFNGLRGTLRLVDDATGEVLDQKTQTLLKVPHFNRRGTFVSNGSNYTCSSQSRVLPSAYTRRKKNGGLETAVTTRLGSGPGFKLSLDPHTALYYLEKGGSRLRLYSVLHDMGVPDEKLEQAWGTEILGKNKAEYDTQSFGKALKIFAKKLDPASDRETQAKALHEAFAKLQVHKRPTQETLPELFDRHKQASTAIPEEGEDYLFSRLTKIAMLMTRAHGACVFLWLGKGYYLLEQNDDGTLRPPGGKMDPGDPHMRATIVREIGEEFRAEGVRGAPLPAAIRLSEGRPIRPLGCLHVLQSQPQAWTLPGLQRSC